jgi:hypothetical protein
MAMFFAPTAALVLSTVRRDEEGIASGAANALRELGGVFGVAVLASVFAGQGGYGTPHLFALGLRPAVEVGAAVVGLAALVLLLVPRRRAGSDAAAVETTADPAESALASRRAPDLVAADS